MPIAAKLFYWSSNLYPLSSGHDSLLVYDPDNLDDGIFISNRQAFSKSNDYFSDTLNELRELQAFNRVEVDLPRRENVDFKDFRLWCEANLNTYWDNSSLLFHNCAHMTADVLQRLGYQQNDAVKSKWFLRPEDVYESVLNGIPQRGPVNLVPQSILMEGKKLEQRIQNDIKLWQSTWLLAEQKLVDGNAFNEIKRIINYLEAQGKDVASAIQQNAHAVSKYNIEGLRGQFDKAMEIARNSVATLASNNSNLQDLSRQLNTKIDIIIGEVKNSINIIYDYLILFPSSKPIAPSSRWQVRVNVLNASALGFAAFVMAFSSNVLLQSVAFGFFALILLLKTLHLLVTSKDKLGRKLFEALPYGMGFLLALSGVLFLNLSQLSMYSGVFVAWIAPIGFVLTASLFATKNFSTDDKLFKAGLFILAAIAMVTLFVPYLQLVSNTIGFDVIGAIAGLLFLHQVITQSTFFFHRDALFGNAGTTVNEITASESGLGSAAKFLQSRSTSDIASNLSATWSDLAFNNANAKCRT